MQLDYKSEFAHTRYALKGKFIQKDGEKASFFFCLFISGVLDVLFVKRVYDALFGRRKGGEKGLYVCVHKTFTIFSTENVGKFIYIE